MGSVFDKGRYLSGMDGKERPVNPWPWRLVRLVEWGIIAGIFYTLTQYL